MKLNVNRDFDINPGKNFLSKNEIDKGITFLNFFSPFLSNFQYNFEILEIFKIEHFFYNRITKH